MGAVVTEATMGILDAWIAVSRGTAGGSSRGLTKVILCGASGTAGAAGTSGAGAAKSSPSGFSISTPSHSLP